MVKEILYDSFGRILSDSNPSMLIPLGFGFGLHDRDVGWVKMGWRDYDPETGRFTAKDPIGEAGGDADWYGYCLDDPVNMVDPMGLRPKEAGVDSAEEPPNLSVKIDGADSAQPQPQSGETDYKAINREWDNQKAATVWGLDPGVDKGRAVKDVIGDDLEVWGKTMKSGMPASGSIVQELGADGAEPADIPRGTLKSFWITE